jgi:SulP family sulfate permease
MNVPKIKYNPKNLPSDLTAGTTTALVTIPDGLASAILAGVNPVNGLYALMVGTPIAALTLSSQFMFVANTGALAVAVGDALGGYIGTEQQTVALVSLTILVGLFQLLLGVLKLGWITRYVSNAVLVGFMTGIAALIILGQIPNLTGYGSQYSNKVVAGMDTIFHLRSWDWSTVIVSLVTLGLIIFLTRTRLAKFNMILALIAASIMVALFNLGSVELIGDISQIPEGFPQPVLPDLSLVFSLLIPAMAIGLVGLIQAAGVSKSVPNVDGNYPDASRDFTGQGLANTAAGVFQGLPIGGTMSETSVNISAGAKTRFASFFSGLLIILVVLLLGDLIELVAMPAVGALLVVAGYSAIKFPEIEDVRDTGAGPRWTMVITFVVTLFLPIQYAVLLGVVLSILIYLYRSSTDIRLVELVLETEGSILERQPPGSLRENDVTILRTYGSLHFSGAAMLEEILPSPQESYRAVVILQLRGLNNVGSTFIRVVERYAQQLQVNGGNLYLTGVHPHVYQQLELTETTETIPEENIYLAEEKLGVSTRIALHSAKAWLEEKEIDADESVTGQVDQDEEQPSDEL